MTCHIHGVVQDANDFNDLISAGAIHHEMPAAPPLARHMQGAQTWRYLVASRAPEDRGTVFESGQGCI